MKLTDTCKCGATFEARGWGHAVQSLYVMWLNGHRWHRDDTTIIELVEGTG